jgi:predicted RNA-binding protein Jag
VNRVDEGEDQVGLNPQGSYVRRLQHKIADKYGMSSTSAGREPERRVVIYRR